jgi:LPXTG-motif cell wall-anchored protein
MGGGFWLSLALGGLLSGTVTVPVAAAEPVAGSAADGEICYIVSDSNAEANDGDAEDLLIRVNRFDSDPATNETNIGTGTGTFNIEAIALQPGTGVLFAADAGVLGTLDVSTGRFTAIGKIGNGTGPNGRVEFNDVDGLSFDATTGLLYGSQREVPGEDLLLVIDPTTGAAVPGKIAGADYGVVSAISDLPDVDALAVDPLDGKMYGVVNDDGRKDHLVRIDKATGQPTDIGVLGAQDVEGLGFASGQLIGTTGKVNETEGIWDIDKTTGAASNRRVLDNSRDYESFDCLNAPNPPAPVAAPSPPARVAGETMTQPAAVAPVAAAAPAPAAPMPLAQLPRTGGDGTRRLAISGFGLTMGGLGLIGSARRRRPTR